eukprot:TRINITY_DN5188_c0_g2_i2.p1 TRINITY_DN5188_c0_g2~~TRINITY_DN5188_c0_g2_i2.p1  ORF type:complete len:356 (-),score=43.47 TRINITY_DN5188_c0_g2_i2:532-1599(-)
MTVLVLLASLLFAYGMVIQPQGPADCAAVTCSLEVDRPLCCDGVFYGNECLARCAPDVNFEQCQPGACAGVDPIPIDPSPTVDPIVIPMEPSLDCAAVLCPAGYSDPVCCSGTTFPNPCLAQCSEQGIENVDEECYPGFCPGDEIVCTADYNPVCCGGQDTYSNLCLARLALGDVVDTVCQEGKCNLTVCPTVYAPVCCLGDEQFSNSCQAFNVYGDRPDFEEICVDGYCNQNEQEEQEEVFCSFEFDPVCCSGITFQNQCEADKELGAYYAYEECIPGECEEADPGNGVVACFALYNPVCCDGEQFSNSCIAGVELGDDVAAEICVQGACGVSTFSPISVPAPFPETEVASDMD